MVGYVDRHESEVMEMDVSAWKGGVSDFTDEEWIPQHRIVYFRKKGDGEGRRVWDRATRLDRLFGSGVAPMNASEVREAENAKEDEADGVTDESEDGDTARVMSEEVSSSIEKICQKLN